MSIRTLTIPLLAIVGGSLDAVVLLGLHVMAAAQTGNTILLVAAVAQGRIADAVDSLVSLVGYVAGTAIGAALIARAPDAARPRATRRVLVVEVALVTLLLVVWRAAGGSPGDVTRAALIAFGALSMGLQSAAVLALRVRPSTTYITGTLTTFTTELIEGPEAKDADVGHEAQRRPVSSRWRGIFTRDQPWIYGVTWVIYAVGALAGALAFRWIGNAAAAVPLLSLLAALVTTRSVE